MIFGMLRHGQTAWNVEKRIQGQTEHALTEEGQAQARRWGQALVGQGWKRLLVSDLGRAVQTAELLNESLGLPMTTDARLREQDWGDWVGSTIAELRQQFPDAVEAQEAQGWAFRPLGGESRTEALHRGLAACGDHAKAHGGVPTLVVTHRGLLKCFAYHCKGWTYLPHEPDPIKSACLHRFTWTFDAAHEHGGRLSILNLNERLEPHS